MCTPMPFQLVNDSSTDAVVGTQTNTRCARVGMPTMSASTILSRRLKRRTRRDEDLFLSRRVAGGSSVEVMRQPCPSGREVLGLLRLDRGLGGLRAARVVQPLGDGRLDDVRHETGIGIAVTELREELGLVDELHRLLLQRV